jgi:serine/threonine protein kinase
MTALLRDGRDGDEPAPPEAADLLDRLLAADPARRMTAAEALQHPYLAPAREPELEEPFRGRVAERFPESMLFLP